MDRANNYGPSDLVDSWLDGGGKGREEGIGGIAVYVLRSLAGLRY